MNITVFCGSRVGKNPAFAQSTQALGQWMGQSGHTLIYGVATNGLMGILADAVLSHHGSVIGVVPDDLKDLEDWHPHLTQRYQVATMTLRKQKMSELADAFIALPGGPGTLEEISEMISWARVKFHQKPCILFNIDGFYNSFNHYLQSMVDQEFISSKDLELVHFVSSIDELIALLA